MQGSHPARALAFVPSVIALILVSSALAQSTPQAAGPCKAYFTGFHSADPSAQLLVDAKQSTFTVFQSADVNAHVVVGLDKQQSDWYKKNGSKKQFAGICLWNMAEERIPAEELVSRIDKLDAPLYVLAWAETTRTETDEIEYLQGRQTSENLPALPTVRTSRRTIHYSRTDSVLARWDVPSHALVVLERSHKNQPYSPASVLVLQDALEAISKNPNPGDSR